jgi:hypothetical protein
VRLDFNFQQCLAGTGIASILLMAATASVTQLSRPATWAVFPDSITLNERRFEKVKNELSARGIVGYVNDLDPSGVARTSARDLSQYSLAPVVVEFPARPDRDIVVGDFSDVLAAPAILSQHELHVVRDFGGGVLLLRPDRH